MFSQFHAVSGPADATRLVNYWADEGFTSIKLYVHVTPDVAAASIIAAHRRGLQVTGHLGVRPYTEAADLGIDDLEHGFFASNDFVRGKKSGVLPLPMETSQSQAALRIDSPECQALLRHLIAKHVAITSTLPVFEGFVEGRPILSDKILTVMSAPARENYYGWWGSTKKAPAGFPQVFAKLMKLEKEFSDEGGMLVAGTDPTGLGNVIAGFGSLREVELLVDAGFTPVQAIKVASLNGARLLGVDKDLGSIEPGKFADLVIIAGDPASSIQDIENIETVFKDGVGYDSSVLIDSVRGCVGIQ
jgi:imidazolonepropionase-like amidohydrolase